MTGSERLALGVDLGGTAIKAGVVTREGAIIGRGYHPTQPHLGVSGVVANMARAAGQAMAEAKVTAADLDGAGLGAPGACDGERGVVLEAVNLGWREVPAARLLAAELGGLPVRLENDANCAALGEHWCGAAAGRRHVVMVTLGTGVGGGLILDGQIYHGAGGWAGELGHIPAGEGEGTCACACGKAGCLETYASATGIVAAARREMEAGRAPDLLRRVSGEGGSLDARLIITAAREGDEAARSVLRRAGERLGLALAGLVTVLNPEMVVVGGGVSRAGPLILEPLRAVISARAMPGPAAGVQVVEAALGNDAGLIGAASAIWR